MTLALAIANLVSDAEAVSGLEVKTERQEANRSEYTLIVTQGVHARESRFGPDRITQSLELVLLVKSPDPAGVSAMVLAIETAILADRRRDGNAQTTTNPDDWTVAEDEGREGTTLTTSIGVVVYES
jgi:hypothetical protein